MREAIVFSGGGAYGAYEVGIAKHLLSRPDPVVPEIYTGTSVGGFNASLMACQPADRPAAAAKRLEQVWLTNVAVNPQTLENGVFRLRGDVPKYVESALASGDARNAFAEFTGDTVYLFQDMMQLASAFALSKQPLAQRALRMLDVSAFFDVEPLRNLVRSTIDFAAIRNSPIALRIAATNWSIGKVKVFENGDMTDERGPSVVMASAAIPSVFPPVAIDGSFYADGGVLANTPLGAALAAKARVIHAIYLTPNPVDGSLPRVENTFDTVERMMTIMVSGKVVNDVDHIRRINSLIASIAPEGFSPVTVHLYHPHEALGSLMGMLNFGREFIESLIEMGYKAAQAHDCERQGCVLAPN
jgi:predicted acylesterase/phospholipase RssA